MEVAYDRLSELVGRDLGWSNWVTVDQAMIDGFADATKDHQWIHVDVARASGLGGTMAHGFLTLALVPRLASEIMTITGVTHMLNAGLNKVRFPTPVRSGSRVRLNQVVKDVGPRAGGLQITSIFTIASDRDEKPACVAESLLLVLP